MSRVFEITNFDEHEAFIANNDKAVIFFGSRGCPHCRNMVPIIEEMANKYKTVAFAHIEVSEVEVENVDGVPVFVGYRMHVPVGVVLGASPNKITNMIETKLL
jgi:thiol-disulfide isomerase/thioredoxin